MFSVINFPFTVDFMLYKGSLEPLFYMSCKPDFGKNNSYPQSYLKTHHVSINNIKLFHVFCLCIKICPQPLTWDILSCLYTLNINVNAYNEVKHSMYEEMNAVVVYCWCGLYFFGFILYRINCLFSCLDGFHYLS